MLQQIPSPSNGEPPSEMIVPPPWAEVLLILLIVLVVTLGTLEFFVASFLVQLLKMIMKHKSGINRKITFLRHKKLNQFEINKCFKYKVQTDVFFVIQRPISSKARTLNEQFQLSI